MIYLIIYVYIYDTHRAFVGGLVLGGHAPVLLPRHVGVEEHEEGVLVPHLMGCVYVCVYSVLYMGL